MRKFTKEWRKKISKALKGRTITEEWRRKLSEANKGKRISKEVRKKISKSLMGRKHPLYGKKMSRETKEKLSQSIRLKLSTKESKELRSLLHKKIQKKLFKDKNFRKKQLKILQNGLYNSRRGMTYPEKLMFKMLKRLKIGFEYTGNFTFDVNGKCPDFRILRSRKLIEVFGDYWHESKEVKKKIKWYKKYGYECLVVWESDLKNDEENVQRVVKKYLGVK